MTDWIYCSERNPEIEGYYLVSCFDVFEKETLLDTSAYHPKGGWALEAKTDGALKIYAWSNKEPAPYKGEEK